jgi:RND family efflux transporter MFP subunit
MHRLLNKAKFYLILIAMLIPVTSIYAEMVEYDGLIEPYVVVDIGASTEGIVDRITVERSSLVKKGQTLVKMESTVERAVLAKAKAMTTFGAEIGLQNTQLAFAKRTADRFQRLDAIASFDKDQAATEIIRVKYRLEQARETRTLAQYELRKAQAVVNRCSIKSPISGVVVERYVSPGEYVDGQPLLRVAQIDPLRVEVIVPSQIFGRIVPGMTATIVPEHPEYGEQTATVTIVDKLIDAASSTFGVRLELPNADQQMPSGLRCQVRFEIDQDYAQTAKVTARVESGLAQD